MRQIQKENFKKWQDLADFLELDKDKRKQILQTPKFPLNLPKRLAKKIQKNCLDDPILLQFLPHIRENRVKKGFSVDPVQELSFQKTPRLLQKYSGRALLICTNVCAMHCRFCFRKSYSYDHPNSNFRKELQMIRDDPSIYEVILSGGDPLSLSDETLSSLTGSLEEIPHLQLLRFHSRFPIAIPERITATFLKILERSHLPIIFVLHTNHPKELDEEVLCALKKIKAVGATLLSQTVLLRGINDSLAVLQELFFTLAKTGIIPYYLHQLDKAEGTAHFEVSISKGVRLIKELREQLPGYAIPSYVQEIPYEKSKQPINDRLPRNPLCIVRYPRNRRPYKVTKFFNWTH